jgi:hypothetical protein
MSQETAAVLLGLFGVINTALLVYQAVRLGQVHSAVDGAHAAALEAAHNAGVVRGIMASSGSVGDFPTESRGSA